MAQWGLGIDAVSWRRFSSWEHYTKKKIERIISPREREYCLTAVSPDKRALRFATHFALREALFKALHHFKRMEPIPFLTLCRLVQLGYASSGCPFVICDPLLYHRYLGVSPDSCVSRVSITHTEDTVIVCALLSLHDYAIAI